MNQLELIEQITSEFETILREGIPREWISHGGSSGPSFYSSLTENNANYKGSRYFYDGHLKFVHWTSVTNLLSIINNREFRLYNLQNSEDPSEFKFAADALSISSEQIDHSKDYLFTLSFCKQDYITNDFLWTTYGKNTSGVAIEFEITNDPSQWTGFMLSNVYYELPDNFITLRDRLAKLKEKYPMIETKIDLGKLIGFHKSDKYNKENEVRLSVYFPYNDIEEYWKYCNTEFRFDPDRPRITNYMGLPLWVNNESAYVKSERKHLDRRQILEEGFFETRPQIKIKQLYFGKNCGITNYQFDEFRRKMDEIIRYKLGYKVELLLNLYDPNRA
jgi:hypothetical protein